MDDRKNDKLQLQDSKTVDLKTLVTGHSVHTGVLPYLLSERLYMYMIINV